VLLSSCTGYLGIGLILIKRKYRPKWTIRSCGSIVGIAAGYGLDD
jgi:hypothetical protein